MKRPKEPAKLYFLPLRRYYPRTIPHCSGSDFHRLDGWSAGCLTLKISICCVRRVYAGHARTEGECRVDSELSYAFGFRAMALARLGQARPSVCARIRAGRIVRSAHGRAGALVQLAGSHRSIALSVDSGSHGASVRLLAGG